MPVLANEKICVGCTACVSVCPKKCIKMKKNKDGFKYPELVETVNCIECGLCGKVCPVLEKDIRKNRSLPVAYAAFSKSEIVRRNSSSGGIFTEVSKQIFAKGGIVYGAAYDEQFEVRHCCIGDSTELYKIQGAKYAESNLGNTYEEILTNLKKGKLILFSGTPCQVAGLKSFIGKDYDNLICIDFVCHGVPSPMVWKEYVKYRAQKDSNGKMPVGINLRAKSTGWSKYQYSNEFRYENGKIYSSCSSENLFMKLFIGNYILRKSCEHCSFKGYTRVSDITLGDFWGIWDIAPEMDDNKGTSLVLLQSEKGRRIWREISENIRSMKVELEKTSLENPAILISSQAKENRVKVLESIRRGQLVQCEELFETRKISFFSKFKRKFKF